MSEKKVVGNVNTHQEVWLGSSTTTLHSKAARDFASSSGCEQTFTEPTHIDGGVLDLVLTYVSDLVGIRVDSPVEISDHLAVFYRYCAGATYTSLIVQARSISEKLCKLEAG